MQATGIKLKEIVFGKMPSELYICQPQPCPSGLETPVLEASLSGKGHLNVPSAHQAGLRRCSQTRNLVT